MNSFGVYEIKILVVCLSFNIKKSKVMIFGNMKGKTVTPLTLYNKPLEFVSQWTYLGSTIVAGLSVFFM